MTKMLGPDAGAKLGKLLHFLPIVSNDQEFYALIDPGAQVSRISRKLLDLCSTRSSERLTKDKVTGINEEGEKVE